LHLDGMLLPCSELP